MPMTLSEIAEQMRDIDICTLATRAPSGAIAARPMSNNREVDFDGDAWFFTLDSTATVPQIEADANVGVTYQRSGGVKGLVGRPGPFFHVEARADLVRDRAAFAAHWHKDLDHWFEQGIDTPGIVLIHARAQRVHYWDGEDSGEIAV
ncbi:MAG: pyridoxamine 5'-phosphate oxidase family protein [Sphingomonadales bacterium]|nr:pyridoxamine 5'-phosphate oxidase family protein [Sphingomonadales bacterium]